MRTLIVISTVALATPVGIVALATPVGIVALATPAGAQPAPEQAPAEAAPAPPPAAPALPQSMGTLLLKTPIQGAPVTIDGNPAGVTPLPGPWTLAPGRHRVVVRPPGAGPETLEVEVRAGQQTVAEVAASAPAAAAEPDAPAAPEARVVHTGPGFSLTTAGYVTAGVGLAAAGAGIFFGVRADQLADDAAGLDRSKPGNSRADQRALVDDSERSAFLANLSYGIAGLAIVSGAAMVLLASDGPLADTPVEVRPVPLGAAFGGRF